VTIMTTVVKNGYMGGKPLTTVEHGKIKGGLDYTIGDSKYITLSSGDNATVSFDLSIPDNATIEYARLYAYWTWSISGNDANLTMMFDGNEITLDKSYVDRKGYEPYDYPSGVNAYSVNVKGSGVYTATVTNVGIDKVSIQGIGLLVVYNDSKSPEIEYWINEGYDLLYASNGVTPEDATTSALFEGSIDKGNVTATLWTVVPSGDKGNNTLYFNEGVWQGIWDGKPYKDLAFNKTDVTTYLETDNNTAQIQDRGDFMAASNAFLVVTKKPPVICPRYDVNEDGTVNVQDLVIVGQNFGKQTTSPYPRYDVNEDGTVNVQDLVIVGQHFGETTPCGASA